LHNHNTNEIINEANETNISEVSNSNGKNETSTNIIDDADASNTPNLSERVALHLNDPNGKYRQNDPQWRRQASEFLGGGAFEGQTHIWGGQDRIFKKVYCIKIIHDTLATRSR
jgi:hypothetical protein